MSNQKIRILIVDDHAVVRKGLAMVLRLENDFAVVGEAGNGTEAFKLAQNLQPDIVLLDRVMPGTDTKKTIENIKKFAPDSWIIMLTGTQLDAAVLEFLSAGVDGYVLKDIEPHELKLAIRTVAAGDSYLQPVITRHVIDLIAQRDISHSLLTPREIEVLQLMATTSPYRQIANQLSISEETVRSHAKHILSKLGQPNRSAAVREALRLGIISQVEINDI